MEQVEIRHASVNDVISLADLSTQLGYFSSSQQVSDRLAVILRSSEHVVLVGCLPNGVVVGWVHAFIALRIESDPFSELGGFVVTEQYRGRGIGRALLMAVEGWVRSRGIKKLRVRVRSTRHDAQVFYQRSGFSRTKDQQVLDKLIEPSA